MILHPIAPIMPQLFPLLYESGWQLPPCNCVGDWKSICRVAERGKNGSAPCPRQRFGPCTLPHHFYDSAFRYFSRLEPFVKLLVRHRIAYALCSAHQQFELA